MNHSQREGAKRAKLDSPEWFLIAAGGEQREAVYVVAETQRVVDSQKAGAVGVDEVEVCYLIVSAEVCKQRGGVVKQSVTVFCKPDILDVWVVFEKAGYHVEQACIGGELFFEEATGAFQPRIDFVDDVLLLKVVDGQYENKQHKQYCGKKRGEDGKPDSFPA
jgi:hypothetical protein